MRRLMVLITVALLAAGCGRAKGGPVPPTIHYGHDTCARCTMIIEDARCAAAVEPQEGDAVLFDDIGDLLVWLDEHPAVHPVATWVHDYEGGEWIEARAATYVVNTRLTTPMGSGIVAAASSDRAAALAARRGGRPVDLASARALAVERLTRRMTSGDPVSKGVLK